MWPPPYGDVVPWIAAAGAISLAAAAAWLRWRRRRRENAGVEGPGAVAGDGTATGAGAAAGPADRFRAGLARSRSALSARLGAVLGRGSLDERLLEDIEQALIESDVGVRATQGLLEALRGIPREQQTMAAVRAALQTRIRRLVACPPAPVEPTSRPWIVLVVGVNGVGKTTTIGKLAARHRQQGRSVLVVAGDTFRAAAIEQLSVWAQRSGAQIVKQEPGADPSSVVFDGVKAAVARQVDVALVDTAGRLHTRVDLMEELKKVRRVIERLIPGAPHEVLLVLDATTGQNAISQARMFSEAVGVTGLVLTKLDGSARGGAVVAIRQELALPVCYVGLGERAEDLQPFDADAYAAALVGEG